MVPASTARLQCTYRVLGGAAALLLLFAEKSLCRELPVLAYYLSGFGYLLLLVVVAVTLVSVYSSYRSVREFLRRDAFEK